MSWVTATPIPRTLSLDDLRSRRVDDQGTPLRPITHRHPRRRSERADDVYRHLDERIEAGEQGFVVVPGRDPTWASPTWSRSGRPSRPGPPRRRLAAAWPTTSPSRDRIMTAFRNRRSTSSWRPWSSRSADAERDDDRGRARRAVRTGPAPPAAGPRGPRHGPRDRAFIGEPATEDGRERFEAIAESDDGLIAELDLEIRAPASSSGSTVRAPRRGWRTPRRPRPPATRPTTRPWIDRDPALLAPDAVPQRARFLDTYGETRPRRWMTATSTTMPRWA